MSNLFVVGYDGSPASRRALDFAVERAEASGAEVLIIHVLEWSPYSFLSKQEVEERTKRRREELSRAEAAVIKPAIEAVETRKVTVRGDIKYGHVADTICQIARSEGAAQIFIGRTGNSGVAARLFGSVAGNLAQSAPVPTTLVP